MKANLLLSSERVPRNKKYSCLASVNAGIFVSRTNYVENNHEQSVLQHFLRRGYTRTPNIHFHLFFLFLPFFTVSPDNTATYLGKDVQAVPRITFVYLQQHKKRKNKIHSFF